MAFAITPDAIEQGIRQTQWPGRFQSNSGDSGCAGICARRGTQSRGAWALRSTISSLYEDRRIIFVFGAMRDKAIREITEILFPLGERVIATAADDPRSASPEEIQGSAERTGTEIELAGDVPWPSVAQSI